MSAVSHENINYRLAICSFRVWNNKILQVTARYEYVDLNQGVYNLYNDKCLRQRYHNLFKYKDSQ